MPPVKRKSYEAGYKVKVIQYAKEHGNRAAMREFGVGESVIRGWRKQEDALKKTKKSRKAFRGDKARWPDLENRVEAWVNEQRAAGRGISTVSIRLKAKTYAKDMDIADFQGGPSWCFRFMRRKELSIRQRTTVCQKLPKDWEEKLESFRSYTSGIIEDEKISMDHVANMDEVPLTFDIPMHRTVEKKGEKMVPIKTTGHEKSSFTVVLSCTASGKKLPPMLIFKRKTIPKEKFPPGVVIRANKKGWMDETMMNDWLDSCYVKRPGGFFKTATSLLVLDSMTAHKCESVKDHLKKMKSKISIIPGGLTKLLQPLDIAVNKSFKDHLRAIWENWMVDGEHSFTKTGRMRRATYAEVSNWVLQAWSKVKVSSITNGFVKSEMLPPNTLQLPMEIDSDDNDEDDDHLTATELATLAELFHDDTEDEDFDGFSDQEDDTDDF